MNFKCDVPKTFCNLRTEDGMCKLPSPCTKVVKECFENGGCNKIENDYCTIYISPLAKWSHSKSCPAASNIIKETSPQQKIKIGQQKQKKYRR